MLLLVSTTCHQVTMDTGLNIILIFSLISLVIKSINLFSIVSPNCYCIPTREAHLIIILKVKQCERVYKGLLVDSTALMDFFCNPS